MSATARELLVVFETLPDPDRIALHCFKNCGADRWVLALGQMTGSNRPPKSCSSRTTKKRPPMPPWPIDRGEVWLTDLGMVAKVRPCLVLSVEPGTADRVLFTLVPHTTSI